MKLGLDKDRKLLGLEEDSIKDFEISVYYEMCLIMTMQYELQK